MTEKFTFPYHKHYLYRLAAYGRDELPALRTSALRDAADQRNPWYLRMAALFCAATFRLNDDELRVIDQFAERESHPQVARAALVALRQLPPQALPPARDHLLFAVTPGQELLREYFMRAATDASFAGVMLTDIETADVASPDFIRCLHRFDLLKTNAAVREILRREVDDKIDRCPSSWPRLRARLEGIRDALNDSLAALWSTEESPEARDHLTALLRATTEAVVTVDRGGRVKVWNDAAAELFG